MITSAPHRCALCREGTVSIESTVNHLEWLSEGLIVIRDIPTIKCTLCGHEYVSLEYKKALEGQITRIKGNRSLARPIAAYQADFQKP